MIDDAWPWKCELLRLSDDLGSQFGEPDLFPGTGVDAETQQIFLVERLVFVTAIVARKLTEAGKVSVQFLGRSIECERRPILDPERAPDITNMHRTLDFYEQDGNPSRISYGDFANLLIHSRSLVTLSDVDAEGREVAWGFAVTSDRTHLKYVSVFSMDDVVRFVEALAQDDVVQIRSLRDGRGDYVAVGSNKHMPEEELNAYLYRAPHKEATNRIRARIGADLVEQRRPSDRLGPGAMGPVRPPSGEGS